MSRRVNPTLLQGIDRLRTSEEAVEQGASLTSPLPDSSLTPLFKALCKFGEPERYDEEKGFRSRTKYAELLSVLTGQPVAKPEVPTLHPELQAENQRFERCLQARRMLEQAVQKRGARRPPLLVAPVATGRLGPAHRCSRSARRMSEKVIARNVRRP